MSRGERAERRHAQREAAEMERSQSFTLTNEDYNLSDRLVVVLPVPWLDMKSIAFFQSTGTSNKSLRHLADTFFPTLGISTGEEPDIMEKMKAGDFIKTGLFKTLFRGNGFRALNLFEVPSWVKIVLIEYCNIAYPGLTEIDDAVIADDTQNHKFTSFLESCKEIYELFDLCIYYFTDVWQIAISIALSKLKGQGVFINRFKSFADFIDTKMIYKITDHSDSLQQIPMGEFLKSKNAHTHFKLEGVQLEIAERNYANLFSGKSYGILEVKLRSYATLKRFKSSGGTRRRKSVKTRRQKRR
jgi:hypothetical protein